MDCLMISCFISASVLAIFAVCAAAKPSATVRRINRHAVIQGRFARFMRLFYLAHEVTASILDCRQHSEHALSLLIAAPIKNDGKTTHLKPSMLSPTAVENA